MTAFGARSIAAKFSWAISPNGLEIMRKTALKYRAELIAREILPDHVRMLSEVDPQCPHCKTDHQRDENAVVNLFVEGFRILAEGRSVIACGDTVRLERKPKHMSAKQETSLETCGHVA
jgi:hypothetical protein